MDPEPKFERRARTAFRSLTSDLPDDMGALSARLGIIRSVTHAEIARALQPQFNERLRSAPKDDLVAKRAICTWANEQLKNLGLAIRCPETGKPSILVGHSKCVGDTEGRFQLDQRERDNRGRLVLSGRPLPELELMEDSPRCEPGRRHRPADKPPTR